MTQTIYRIIFPLFVTPTTEELITIEIFDLDYDHTLPDIEIVYKDLECPKDVLFISTLDLGDDKLTPIKAKKAEIKFISTDEVTAATFSEGEDKRFLVKITYNAGGVNVFKGYLVMDDMTEPFLPVGSPITLTALDGLGLLKEIELCNQDGTIMQGRYKIIQFVANCLYQVNIDSGLDSSIYVACNLYEILMDTRTVSASTCPWNQAYVNADDYKLRDGYISMYEVLTSILKDWGARISLNNGDWWIERIDEKKNPTIYYTKYAESGAVSTGGTFQSDRNIGKAPQGGLNPTGGNLIYFINKDAIVQLQRPFKFAKIEYPLELPDEIIRNMNFQRGAEFASTATTKHYNIDDWTRKRFPIESGATPQGAVYIRRVFDSGYETSKYVVIEPRTTGVQDYIESYPLEVCEKYKFDFSVDVALSEDHSGGGSVTDSYVLIRLLGDDGTTWTLDDDGKWYQSNGTWSTNIRTIQTIWIPDDRDERDWFSVSISAEPVPKTGNLYILLCQSALVYGEVDPLDVFDRETRFSNLTLDLKPFVDGTYTEFIKETFKVSQDGNYGLNRTEEMGLFDAPCKVFKHSMTTLDGVHILTTLWNDWVLTDLGSGLTDQRFGWWQAHAIWNQYRGTVSGFSRKRGTRYSECTLQGILTEVGDPIDIHHRLTINVSSPHTYQKRFMILSMEQNWRTGEGRYFLAEINDTEDQRSFTNDFEHKYIENA